MDDPRHRNRVLRSGNSAEFVADYAKSLGEAVASLDSGKIDAATELLVTASRNGRAIYAIGNGGSGAVADHLCCDLTKGTYVGGEPALRAISLAANGALFSAVANDFGFESAFSRLVEMFGDEGDVLIAVSSSGNSENILRAIGAAKARGMKTIGLCGFSGGRLKDEADVVFHVPVENYGIVEDAHMSIMHIVAQIIGLRRDGKLSW